MSIGKSSISRLSGGMQNPAEKTAKKFPEANEVTETAAKKAEEPAKSAAKKATGKRTKENAKTATVPTKAGVRKKSSVSEAEELPAKSVGPAVVVTAPEESAVEPAGESRVTAAFCAVGDALPYWLL